MSLHKRLRGGGTEPKTWTDRRFGIRAVYTRAKCACGEQITVAVGWPGTPTCDACFDKLFPFESRF